MRLTGQQFIKKKDPRHQMNISYKTALHYKSISLLTLSYPNITLSNYWFISISDKWTY